MTPSIDLQANSWISYALAYNKIPFIHRIRTSGLALNEPSFLSVRVEADGVSLSRPHDLELEPDASGVAEVGDVLVPLDLGAVHRLEEDRRAEIVCSVRVGDEEIERRQDVLFRSASTWSTIALGGVDEQRLHPLATETLAAFVQPNDPTVTTFMEAVRRRLLAQTGSSSTDGYQSDANRVDAIAKAIWDEARSRDVDYSNPPASWLSGQKVRSPQQVLEGGVGTCLDTSVVLAAALEHAGLNPLLFIVEGHAFLGYWRDERFAITDVEDVEAAANFVDAGVIRVLETTTVTGGSQSETFDSEVHAMTRGRYLTGDLSRFNGVVDVSAARRNGIVPLPARHVMPDGAVAVVEYHPAQHSGHVVRSGLDAVGQTPQSTDSVGPIPARVQVWKNSLLDLSLRNRLINFTQQSAVQLAVPTGSIGHLEDMLNAGQSVALQPGDAVTATQSAQGVRLGAELPPSVLKELLDAKKVFTDVNTGDSLDPYLRKMRNLAYKARTVEEETGANNLYLALGSLHWEIDGRPLKSPLILLPVTLTPGSRRGLYRLQLDEAGSSTPNFCLVEKLRQTDGLVIPQLENPIEDEHGIDLAATFEAVRAAIMEKELPYRVDETADVAILQFGKFRLWKDLDDDWEALLSTPLVRHLVQNPTGAFEDPRAQESLGDLDELDALCPIPADASQLEAIAAAVAGRTFVLEGPPGTGKSQTITNLLARAIAAGKRVLFVAEKRAALDVVSSRLDSIGMGPFSLDLHDKSSKPALVREQIKQALDLAVEFDAQGLAATGEIVDSARRSLQRYTTRLHEVNAAGLSFYTARTQALAYAADLPALPVSTSELLALSAEAIGNLRLALRTLEDTADLARPRRHHPWGFIRTETSTSEAVMNAARTVDQQIDLLPRSGPLAQCLAAVQTQDDLDTLAGILHGPAVTLAEMDSIATRSWAEARDAYLDRLRAFLTASHPGTDRAEVGALDLPLRQIREAVSNAQSSSVFGRKKRTLDAMTPLTPHLRATVKPKSVGLLLDQLITTREAADELAPERSGVAGLRPWQGWNPLRQESVSAVEAQLAWLEHHAKRLASGRTVEDPFGAALRELLSVDPFIAEEEKNAVRACSTSARALWEATGTSESDLTTWLAGSSLLETLVAGQPERPSDAGGERSLNRWLAFIEHASVLRAAGLQEAFDAILSGDIGTTSAAASFDKGLALASMEERRVHTGLDSFDAEAHDRSVVRFASSMHELRDHLRQSVAADVVGSRPFGSSTERGQVGALRREINRQRGGMKVRELLRTYGSLITQVMPCVLVSPDSVARFFPVGSVTFDLVVFDEASQIRVADAIGAMGRATSAVIVGDSKQMPPTSFADPADDSSFAEAHQVEQDQESILTEVAQAGVANLALTWHYRSKDESLIAFSNENYYDRRLSSFPAPRTPLGVDGRPTAGVSLVRVDGTFVRAAGRDKGTNRAEAEAIVAEIRDRFRAYVDATPSIGVVTFNMPQRTLIESMLRDTEDLRIIEALDGTNGEGLFVKNLENVQGDERDVILFSTAFSKNDSGKLPLNFGPLTNKGGERRLNVAITRARIQVVIFTSFDPSELRVEETASVGIKHLAGYMAAAKQASSGLAPVSARPVSDRHRDEVAKALEAAGLVVQTDLGLSDFKIDLALADPGDPGRPVVAVLLDGEGWASRRTVGDRDGLPVAVLGGLMGWRRVERVWLPEWLSNREDVIERLVLAVADAKKESPGALAPLSSAVASSTATFPPVAKVASSAPASSAEPAIASVSVPIALPGSAPFVPWTVRRHGDRAVLDSLPYPDARARVARVIDKVVEFEGPVQLERLARLVAGAFDLTRLNRNRIDSIVQCVPRDLKDREGFAWPRELDRSGWTAFRTADSSAPRPVEEVHAQEMANAIVALCRDAHGMSEEEILREALALFGWKRRTEALSKGVRRGLAYATKEQRLTMSDIGIFSPHDGNGPR